MIIFYVYLLPVVQVKGPEGDGLRMVPKRQIQLRKKKDIDNIINQEKTEKLQVR